MFRGLLSFGLPETFTIALGHGVRPPEVSGTNDMLVENLMSSMEGHVV